MPSVSRNDILFETAGNVATLTLNRPEKLNALTAEMSAEIGRIAREVDTNDEIRVLVVTGAGDRAFSAGSDINLLGDLGTMWESRNRAQYDRDYVTPLLWLRKPLIAAIDGYCLGGGLEIAICADVRIASGRAKFGAPEVRHGWHAGSGNTSILPRLIGYGNAGRWILTGDMFDAAEAHRVGFVQELVEAQDLMPRALALAARIAKNPPLAVQSAKNIIRQSQGVSIAQGLAWENDGCMLTMFSEDGAEGRKAFAEKREPNFRGR